VRPAAQASFAHALPAFRRARALALLLPSALLAGAWGSQLIGGLNPCHLCLWQRWPHYAAVAVALAAYARPSRSLVALAALLIAASGVIGVAHAGAEYGWWTIPTSCTSLVTLSGNADDRLAALMANKDVVRCDVAQWTLAGVSLAGFNALFSLGGALTIWTMLMRRVR